MKNTRNFLLRSLSSIFIVVLITSFVYLFNYVFSLFFLTVIAILMAYEWNEITISNGHSLYWKFLGCLYISLTVLPLLYIKYTKIVPLYGAHFLMLLFIIIWSTDTFAYIVGRTFGLGSHKITKISPNKSYEGLIGGIVGAICTGSIFLYKFLPFVTNKVVCVIPILCILEQISDILESAIKRRFNKKDSGSIIPGHGGILDRLDGFLLTNIAFVLMLHFILL